MSKPSALENLSKIKQLASNKELVVFLDYDGTLSPIVPIPDDAIISEETRAAVKKVSEKFKTAIVSGRKKDDVKSRVGLNGDLYYAGSHGFDIEGPGSTQLKHQVAQEFLPILGKVYSEFEASELKKIEGCILENNKFSLSVHYRCIPKEEDVKRVFDIVDKIKSKEEWKDKIRLTHGKKVIEVRPNYDWHKGKAVIHLLKAMKLDDPSKVYAIYLGDDTTDEDAFKALKEEKLGGGILVATETERIEKTNADFLLKDVKEVNEFLKKICE